MLKILFLCTHNRCRSILAEALARHLGEGRIEAVSAGSEPAGQVHPQTLRWLERHHISTAGLASEGWEAHEKSPPDVVITVCDAAAGEACPVWLGDVVKVHWGVADPSRVAGDQTQIDAAFDATAAILRRRIEAMLALPLETLRADRPALTAALRRIAETIR